MRKRTATALVTLTLVAAACGGSDDPKSLTLFAHDSFAGGVTEQTFAGFTEETGIEVEVIAAGDAGALVNQAILTKDNPLADVIYGVDNTFLSRALDADIFQPSLFIAGAEDPVITMVGEDALDVLRRRSRSDVADPPDRTAQGFPE